MCNLDVWTMDISRRLMSLRNFLLRLMSAQLMSTTASTLLQGKYKGIAETCQMTMNYVLFR
jgi:hypothetical protein